ncbi:MAG: hypothetical protein HZC54_06635 [Verrucomicrobia bacterium]|nr:hypothetical protein [Verrucomicrobiota bacterium]
MNTDGIRMGRWVIAAVLLFTTTGCKFVPWVMLENGSKEEIVAIVRNSSGRERQHRIPGGKSCKIPFVVCHRMELQRTGKRNAYFLKYPGKEYFFRGPFSEGIYLKFDEDGKLYVMSPEHSGTRDLPAQPPGYPVGPDFRPAN